MRPSCSAAFRITHQDAHLRPFTTQSEEVGSRARRHVTETIYPLVCLGLMSLTYRPAACRRTPVVSVSIRPAACSTNEPTRNVVVTRRTCLKGRDLAFCTCLLHTSLCLNSYFSVCLPDIKANCFIGMCPESCRSNSFVWRRELFTKPSRN